MPCSSTHIRTIPPHKNPVNRPNQEWVIKAHASAGIASPDSTNRVIAPADPNQFSGLQNVARIEGNVGIGVRCHPRQMRMDEPLHLSQKIIAVQMRRVKVPLPVCALMVTAMHGDPG